MIVAIDGPAGVGKSTVAKLLASRLGLLYLDTGALYRAVAWGVLRHGVEPADAEAVAGLLPKLSLQMEVTRQRCDGLHEWKGRDQRTSDAGGVGSGIRGLGNSSCQSLASAGPATDRQEGFRGGRGS